MKCYNRDQIEAIIVNRDIGSLSSHIDNCPSCSALYEAALKEQLIWHETLFPGKLPDAFDTTVMAALESHTIDPFSEGGGKGQGETDSRCRREMSGKWLIIAAASLVILGGSLLYARPTIADLIRSLLTADGSTDIGIIESNQLGIVQNPGIKVEDKGYTLEINEVVADGARIVMGVKLTDPQGRPIKDKLDWSKLKIINANGTEIAAMSSRGGASNFDNLEFAYTTMDETDRIFVEGNFDRIGSKFDGKPFVYGDWGFRFELDMTEINKLKLVNALHEQYTSPNGLTIEMKGLIRTPGAVQLQLVTSLNAEAAERSPGDLAEKVQLMFYFEDENGEEISSVNSLKVPHKDSLISMSHYTDKQTGRTQWNYFFKYLPYDRQKVTFVLEGYSIPEKSGASVTFRPADLQLEPLVFMDQGDALTISEMKIDKGFDSNSAIVGLIHIKGKFRNSYVEDEWSLRDENGREYPLSMRGGISRGEVTDIKGDPGFIADGMTALPSEVTLIRQIIDKRYFDVNWSFELPRGEQFQGIKEVDPSDYGY